MYYELYIDVLFLVNFMMDYLLLLTVKKILKCSATHGNIAVGSLVGSFCTCAVIAMPLEIPLVKWILFHGVIHILMIRTGLRIKWGKGFLRALIALYAGGFLLGGIFTYLHQYVRAGSLFFALAVASYWIVQGVWSFLGCMHRIGQYQCEVTLCYKGEACRVNAIIDTGNSLWDPLTDRPVCVVEQGRLQGFIGEGELYGLRTIGFHSIGKEDGQIPVLELEKMCVHRDEECWVEHPVVGICGERISANGGYDMILNPDIF